MEISSLQKPRNGYYRGVSGGEKHKVTKMLGVRVSSFTMVGDGLREAAPLQSLTYSQT